MSLSALAERVCQIQVGQIQVGHTGFCVRTVSNMQQLHAIAAICSYTSYTSYITVICSYMQLYAVTCNTHAQTAQAE